MAIWQDPDVYRGKHLRKIAVAIAALAFLACGGCAIPAPPPFPAATPAQVVKVTNSISAAVVRLDVAQTIYSEGKRTVERGIGSGVIIDAQGHVLTNYHVAGRAVEIYITLFSKERIPAHLVGDDHWTDLAIVQMDMDAIRAKKTSFTWAPLGDSSSVVVGQDALAVGTPYGLARTMTRGAISNTDRTFYPTRLDIDGYETGDYSNWIQMDVPINPGNSGGPLVDFNGNVIGINTRAAGQGLNFAIPINTARPVIAEILRTATPTQKGRVRRADLGLDLKPLQDLEQFYNIDVNRGVLVNSVDPHSAGDKAGVQTQDILLAINGQPINVRFPEELAAARQKIADLPIGQPCTLSLKRAKNNIELQAVTDELQGLLGDERELNAWGIAVREVTRAYANRNHLDDAVGVVVASETPDYPADLAEVRTDDVILAINGVAIKNLADLIEQYTHSVDARDPRVLLGIARSRSRLSAVMNVTYDKPATTEPISPASTMPATRP